MSDSSSFEDLQAELLNDFIIESTEGLDLFDQELLKLENLAEAETLNVIFRVIHTIKGTAGCLALAHIERVSHSGENLLSLMREGEIASNQDIITTLLKLSDVLREHIQVLEETGQDKERDNSQLLEDLERHQNPQETAEITEDAGFGLFEEEPAEAINSEPDETAFGLFDEPEPTGVTQETIDVPQKASSEKKTSLAESSIRVSVDQLDKVMNMVGELVLARNQIVVNTTNLDEAALLTASQRLNIITTELQESVMKTRMQPIGNIWAKFPRVVRDVSTELGKEVRLIMEGQDTELDRTIIEAIKDPLTHIVRNAIDHGIESPEKRNALGKPTEGFLSLRAYHEGGQIIIEIMDDGAGINVDRVTEKAIEKNLITPTQANSLTEKEAINLIFQPGFSTADRISNVSGRGVGMDVVKTNIEKTGGSVDISSELGQGSTIKIKIPLTLAIIPALTITSGGDKYAIPQVSLLELLRIEGEQSKTKIEELFGSPVYRLRGKLLPLAYLNEQLKIAPLEKQKTLESGEDHVINIIVLQADGRQFGLVVDEINNTEEIVVKALGKQIKNIACFAGATIMGDGKVALILDVLGIAQHANIINGSRERSLSNAEEKEEDSSKSTETLLIFTVDSNHRMAIPLSQAARLEEFDPHTIEHSGNQEVVQYRDNLLPLIRISDYIQTPHKNEATIPTEKLQVVVYSDNGSNYGLVVESIQDILEESITIHKKSNQTGILGSVVIQDRVTDLLDVKSIITQANENPIIPNFA